MILRPKYFLGIASLIIIFGYLILKHLGVPTSEFNITGTENKFKVSFEIAEVDRQNFSKFTQKLSVPPKISEGFEFELDSTSSARLAFASPINSQMRFEDNKIIFSGTSTQPFLNNKTTINKNLKLPRATTTAIFASNLIPQASSLLKLPPDLQNWLRLNFGINGHCLLVFGQNNDVALIANKKEQVDLSELESLKIEGQKQLQLKQEIYDNTTFYLLKIADREQNEITVTFFEVSDFIILTSTQDAAKQLLDIQLGKTASMEFQPPKNNLPISLMLLLKNDEQQKLPEAVAKILADDKKSQEFIKNVKMATLTLTDNKIEGFVEIF